MRKLIAMAALLMMFLSANAQKNVGEWSFIPRLGMNLSNVSNMDVWTGLPGGTEEVHKPSYTPGVVAGMEVEYQLMDPLGISVAALYSQQGCHYSPFTVYESETKAEGTENFNYDWQYLNVPVTANLYFDNYYFLAFLRVGLQAGVYLSGKNHYEMAEINIDKNGHKTNGDVTIFDEKMQNMKPVVWSIPVGFGLEYDHVLVDVRYNIPLSQAGNGEFLKGSRNKVWSFSVGYRF